MLTRKRIALNRIISPSQGLEGFVKFSAGLGLSQIELRNDLPGKSNIGDIIDGLSPTEALRISRGEGVRFITINALQKFNLPAKRSACLGELEQLLDLAAAIECPALVLCPNNDKGDTRSPKQKYLDTVEALQEYGPLFVKYGIAAYVEALGFGISSLASLPAIVRAIKASGYGCYRVLLDTFHHYIGPDDEHIFGMDGLGASYELLYTGLVHISGVEDDIPVEKYLDSNRVLVGPGDKMHNKELIQRLDALGYLGTFSYEPFGPAVQKLSPDQLSAALKASFEYLGVK
ncbi:xylose isomerase domain protein TIM barrel [Treponema primitia ZAS-2]|uniref:Xylose isomerase domain protein TIM barrel n=1 Tax=Treponema primitia (strain ATCC BAA-887 / DSM 12427 / ZAS-2) TaxID=545694 RepID=F5YMA2_TREPZ|nr:TIM barrel protein [Treponema primitia]AEF85943.1 xylose isomerase domain protein TIM barrel [Treponema primitia ZAS-2]